MVRSIPRDPRPAGDRPRIRPVGAGDRTFVRELSRRVFSRFGRYEQMVPEWLDGAGVWGFVALVDGLPAGFALVSLTRLAPGSALSTASARDDQAPLGLDLMAIAVQPERQGNGLGRLLLDRVVAEADRLAGLTDLPVVAVTLTVALDNEPARRLFDASGFAPLGSGREAYPRGQKALRMVRRVGRARDAS